MHRHEISVLIHVVILVCISYRIFLIVFELSSFFSYAASWTNKNKDINERESGSTINQLPSARDCLVEFLVRKPPVGLEKTQALWVALTLWIGLVGAALFLQS
ncbi:Tetratricopeptide repeat-like superfamily, partial [Olea europaea subsp. europaea]